MDAGVDKDTFMAEALDTLYPLLQHMGGEELAQKGSGHVSGQDLYVVAEDEVSALPSSLFMGKSNLPLLPYVGATVTGVIETALGPLPVNIVHGDSIAKYSAFAQAERNKRRRADLRKPLRRYGYRLRWAQRARSRVRRYPLLVTPDFDITWSLDWNTWEDPYWAAQPDLVTVLAIEKTILLPPPALCVPDVSSAPAHLAGLGIWCQSDGTFVTPEMANGIWAKSLPLLPYVAPIADAWTPPSPLEIETANGLLAMHDAVIDAIAGYKTLPTDEEVVQAALKKQHAKDVGDKVAYKGLKQLLYGKMASSIAVQPQDVPKMVANGADPTVVLWRDLDTPALRAARDPRDAKRGLAIDVDTA